MVAKHDIRRFIAASPGEKDQCKADGKAPSIVFNVFVNFPIIAPLIIDDNPIVETDLAEDIMFLCAPDLRIIATRMDATPQIRKKIRL